MRNRCVYCFEQIHTEKGDAHEDCARHGRRLDDDQRQARSQVADALFDLRGPVDSRLLKMVLAELVDIRVILGRGGRGDEGDVQETVGKGER